MEKIIRQAEKNIEQAIADYKRHTHSAEILNDVTDKFIKRLAKDSSYAKQGLRELFSQEATWIPELDAFTLDGTKLSKMDHTRVLNLTHKLLRNKVETSSIDTARKILAAVYYFNYPNEDSPLRDASISAINELVPKAYTQGKKPSYVLRDFCTALGIANEKEDSESQKLYTQLFDELSENETEFKLFVSINPAHFLTMSNPKGDVRGESMISCHSLNSTEYDYNNGCTGLARDETSFIVFTVDDPDNAESLNNRKTSSQIFAYKPGNGVLLQSKMYDTSDDTLGITGESKIYLDMIQKEIARLEKAPNVWETGRSTSPEYFRLIETDKDFGGYRDWNYRRNECTISVREDHKDDHKPIPIGKSGLCLHCGEEISYGLFCKDAE